MGVSERLPANYCPACGAELEPTDPDRGTTYRCPEHGRVIITTTTV